MFFMALPLFSALAICFLYTCFFVYKRYSVSVAVQIINLPRFGHPATVFIAAHCRQQMRVGIAVVFVMNYCMDDHPVCRQWLHEAIEQFNFLLVCQALRKANAKFSRHLGSCRS